MQTLNVPNPALVVYVRYQLVKNDESQEPRLSYQMRARWLDKADMHPASYSLPDGPLELIRKSGVAHEYDIEISWYSEGTVHRSSQGEGEGTGWPFEPSVELDR
jgi:hypothetical protein